ncbi:MAG: response regulator, partial [Anaerolineae bacterium]|nr:response regulator [Anaerolineae bacterium]
ASRSAADVLAGGLGKQFLISQSFDADIEISLNGHFTSAKSILGLLTLCAGYGAEVKLTAVGADAEEAIMSITALFACGFHEAQDVVAHGAETTGEAALRDKGATILIADDEAGIREMVKRILEGNGYQTVTARNGVEAVGLLTANGGAINAVVLDMVMPEMSGLEAMSAIRRMSPHLPLLAMSGSLEGPPIGNDAATAFLRKPFGRAELLPILRTLLDRAALGHADWASSREGRVESEE